MALLPDAFRDLEPWVEQWALPDSRARAARRQASAYTDLERFYEAMLVHADAALADLSQHALGALDPPRERLLKLLLSLAEIGPAVEWYRQSRVVDGFPAERFELVHQIPDLAPQE